MLKDSARWGLGLTLAALACLAGPRDASAQHAIDPPSVTAPFPIETNASARSNIYWSQALSTVQNSTVNTITKDRDQLDQGMRSHTLIHGNRALKEVALTFDDGPHPGYTIPILDILKAYNARATFFVVGEMAEKYPDLVRMEIAAGDSVGNHTYHHVNLTKIPEAYVGAEIAACGDVLKNITGQTPVLFRPPGGDYDAQVARDAEALGYTMVLWTDDPGDYASPGSQVIEDRLLERVNNGGVILIHDGIQQTIDILPHLITTLHDRGFQCVTVDQLMRDRANQHGYVRTAQLLGPYAPGFHHAAPASARG